MCVWGCKHQHVNPRIISTGVSTWVNTVMEVYDAANASKHLVFCLCRPRDGVGHDALAVDTEEAAPVRSVALLQNKLLVTQVQEAVKFLRVLQTNDKICGSR